jgi:hypothetical protein
VSQDHLPHDAIGTLSQLFCDIVSFVNDKVLVEHLEILPASHIRHLVANLAVTANMIGT